MLTFFCLQRLSTFPNSFQSGHVTIHIQFLPPDYTNAGEWMDRGLSEGYAFCSKFLLNDPYIDRVFGRFDSTNGPRPMSPFGCILDQKICALINMRAKWIVMPKNHMRNLHIFFGHQLLWNPKYVPFPKSTRHTTHISYDVNIGIAGNRAVSFKTHIYFCILSGRSTLERERMDKLE